MNIEHPDSFPRMNCIVVFNKDKDRILFCKRVKDPFAGRLNFVGGKVEKGESSGDAAYRELYEETGITRSQIRLFRLMDITYYHQAFVLEMYVGMLSEDVELREEKNPLLWLPLTEDYTDRERFAGEQNIAHIINVAMLYPIPAESRRMKIRRIRSGGQTGVDRAALDLARKYGIGICGWCPRGGWAEDLPEPPGLLTDYPELRETPSEGTAQRTLWNMRDADAILTIIPEGSAESRGTEVGLQEAVHLHKPMYTAHGLDDIPQILSWLESLPDGLDLAVGGPRASECPEAYEITAEILTEIMKSAGFQNSGL